MPVKKIASIALILLMSTQCFYKLGVITYFYLNRDYVAKVLCVNKERPVAMCKGQCYLKKHLALADQSNSHDGTIPDAKQLIDFPVFLVSAYISPVVCGVEKSDPNFHYTFHTSTKHSLIPFQPPALS